MSNDYCVMTVLVEAAKKKSVRLHESDFRDGDVECLNNYVMVFRGRAADVIYSLFKGDECSLPAHQVTHDGGSVLRSADCRGRDVGNVGNGRKVDAGGVDAVVHNYGRDVATPNDPKLSDCGGRRAGCGRRR